MRRALLVLGILPLILLLICSVSGTAPTAGGATTCGEERWAVKTLSDKRERLVNFQPKDTTVNRLRKKLSPGVGSNTPRIKGVETTTWRIKVSLVEMKLEDDHDIHLVVSAPGKPAKTMITEFPDTTCKGAASSPKKASMAKARSKLIARCGSPPSSDFRHLT